MRRIILAVKVRVAGNRWRSWMFLFYGKRSTRRRNIEQRELPLYAKLRGYRVSQSSGSGKISAGVIVSADTIVCLDDRVMGKPQRWTTGGNDVETLIRQNASSHHPVLYLWRQNGTPLFHEVSKVTFYAPSQKKKQRRILATKEPLDKARRHGIKGKVHFSWKNQKGTINIVGLPIARLKAEMEDCLK